MTSPLAQLLSQAVTGSRSPVMGVRGPVPSAQVPQPAHTMKSPASSKLPGKNAPKGPTAKKPPAKK